MSKRISRRKHSSAMKFQIVLESLTSKESRVSIARRYGISATLLSRWINEFLSKGHLVFEKKEESEQQAKTISHLQRLLGKKEVELDLLKKFLGHIGSP